MHVDGNAHSDTATGATCLAARPAPGSKLGPSEASVSTAVLERLGLAAGQAVALRNGEHAAWAVARAHGRHDDRLVRLGRMLWPQLAVRPGETVALEAAGELPEAGTARITPPYNLTFNLHQRLLERLRDDRMSATELVGSVQGETEANLRLLFSRALAHAPSLVMIDEFDVIATNRERLASQSDVRAASQLLTLMDGLEEVDGLILMATTNRIQAIDPAFRRPGRFEEEIFVGPPSASARAEILSIHTREMPLTVEAQDAITAVADETGGFTGADLMHLARSAGLEAANRLAKGREGFELADSLEGTELAVELADFEAALRTVRPSVLRDVVTRAERITWDQIVGLGELKARLRDLGRRAVESDAAATDAEDRAAGSGQGVLLYGPPGSGKSALVHALASELGVNFVAIEGSKVYNQWLGESEETVRALFRRAGEARPSLVMLDHLDALAPVRAGESGERTDERVVSALLASLDDVLAAGSVFVVGASNRPELIDPAVLRSGRLGVHLEVANPDRGRRAALIAALAGVHRLELDEDLTAELAESTDGWSAADIMMLAGEAASRSAMEDRPMSFDDLVDALPAITRL